LSDHSNALIDEGKLDKALERLEQALDICTEAGGSRHINVAGVLTCMGMLTGALASARGSVRIYTKLGITDSPSQKAANIVSELEGVASRADKQPHLEHNFAHRRHIVYKRMGIDQ
jgi:hypothetical protein